MQHFLQEKLFEEEDYKRSGYLVNDWINGEKNAQGIECPRPCPLDEILVDRVIDIRQERFAGARIREEEAAHCRDDEEVEEAPGPGGHTVEIVDKWVENDTLHLLSYDQKSAHSENNWNYHIGTYSCCQSMSWRWHECFITP